MAWTKKTARLVDAAIAHYYGKHFSGRSIDVLDIPKFYRDVRAEFEPLFASEQTPMRNPVALGTLSVIVEKIGNRYVHPTM